ASLLVGAMLAFGSVASIGCAKVGEIKARKAFKSANQAYQAQDYKKAAGLYEETVAADPGLAQAYFYLGNSYDNLYKPSKKGEPANCFALAKIYEDAGAFEEAEKMLQMAKQAKPSDPAVYMTLAGYYNRQGRFDKTIEALEERAQKEPNNPEAFYTIATYYWDESYRDFKHKEAEKKAFVGKGVEAVDHELQIRPDYM